MADRDNRPYWTGAGISIGAGIGLVVGLLGWGGGGIALGVALGAGIGLVVGAIADSMRTT